ncbi:MAG: glycoside hydrolase family 88 protein [Candidatus Kapaibacterium sp.]
MDSTLQTLNHLIDSWSERHRPESMSTDWGQAVLAYGMATAVRATGNDNGREYMRRWLTYHLGAGVHLTYFVGSWGIGLLYPEIVEDFPEYKHELGDLADRLYDLILHKAIRNGQGVLLHNVDLPHIYIDTIYFSAPVLAKLAKTLGRDGWKPEALRQLRAHLEVLRDTESNFFIHCEQNLTGLRSEGAWGRGNGWVAMTCAELLPALDPDSEEFGVVSRILHSLSTHLLPLQTEKGLWRTLVNNSASYEETSASAMFLFGMIRGRRTGVLGGEFDEPIERGIAGISDFIDEKGVLLGSSEGTWPGTIEYYQGLDRGEWWWGTGAFLLALTEFAAMKSGRDVFIP